MKYLTYYTFLVFRPHETDRPHFVSLLFAALGQKLNCRVKKQISSDGRPNSVPRLLAFFHFFLPLSSLMSVIPNDVNDNEDRESNS